MFLKLKEKIQKSKPSTLILIFISLVVLNVFLIPHFFPEETKKVYISNIINNFNSNQLKNSPYKINIENIKIEDNVIKLYNPNIEKESIKKYLSIKNIFITTKESEYINNYKINLKSITINKYFEQDIDYMLIDQYNITIKKDRKKIIAELKKMLLNTQIIFNLSENKKNKKVSYKISFKIINNIFDINTFVNIPFIKDDILILERLGIEYNNKKLDSVLKNIISLDIKSFKKILRNEYISSNSKLENNIIFEEFFNDKKYFKINITNEKKKRIHRSNLIDTIFFDKDFFKIEIQ